jgi:hypothetical protein
MGTCDVIDRCGRLAKQKVTMQPNPTVMTKNQLKRLVTRLTVADNLYTSLQARLALLQQGKRNRKRIARLKKRIMRLYYKIIWMEQMMSSGYRIPYAPPGRVVAKTTPTGTGQLGNGQTIASQTP